MKLLHRLSLPLLLAVCVSFAPFAFAQAIVEKPQASKPVAEQPKLTEFGALHARLTEKAGYFGSDNLVSNELSMLHVLGKLKQMNVTGGVYLGVGPDQNYSYIAQIKPKLAIMIDIRREAGMQHLLYKALMMMAQNRVEYLALLTGRPIPKDAKRWNDKTIRDLVEYFDRTPQDPKLVEKLKLDVRRKVESFGFPLEPRDYDSIAEIHRAFYEDCLEVRYTIRDRNTGRFFPAFRDLLLEKDLAGNHRNYLADEASFQVVKAMHDANKIIPITGDLSGTKAVRAVGEYLKEIGETVSAFYVSNVEFYLFRQNSFDRWVENLKFLPINERSVIIRSYFNYAYYTDPHPQTVDNSFSVQLLQPIGSLIKAHNDKGFATYLEMTRWDSWELMP